MARRMNQVLVRPVDRASWSSLASVSGSSRSDVATALPVGVRGRCDTSSFSAILPRRLEFAIGRDADEPVRGNSVSREWIKLSRSSVRPCAVS